MIRASRAIRFSCALLLVLTMRPALGSTVRPLNIEQLVARAGRILVGRCVAAEPGKDGVLGMSVTRYTFEAEIILKGAPGTRVEVTQVAGETTAHGGPPRFTPGERVLLFLYGPGSAGLSSPVGFGQGKFTIGAAGNGPTLAANEFGNAHLFRGLSPAARERLGALAREPGRGALPLEDLLQMVRRLSDEGPRP